MHTTCFGHSWGGFAKSGRFSCTTASCERGCMTHGGDRTGAMLQFFFPQCFTSWRQTCFIVISLLWWECTYFTKCPFDFIFMYIIYTWNMYVPTTHHADRSGTKKAFSERTKNVFIKSDDCHFRIQKRCPPNATHPENKYMAFIKGLYEGSWWLIILSRSQPQCHWGTAIQPRPTSVFHLIILGIFWNQNFLKRFFFFWKLEDIVRWHVFFWWGRGYFHLQNSHQEIIMDSMSDWWPFPFLSEGKPRGAPANPLWLQICKDRKTPLY